MVRSSYQRNGTNLLTKFLHGIQFFFHLLPKRQLIIGQSFFTPRFKVSTGSKFTNIIRILGVRFETDGRRTLRAADKEAQNLDAQVIFAPNFLLLGIEFLAFVNELAAIIAAHRERSHQPDFVDWSFSRSTSPGNQFRVKVRRKIFIQNFTLGHFCVVLNEKVKERKRAMNQPMSAISSILFLLVLNLILIYFLYLNKSSFGLN